MVTLSECAKTSVGIFLIFSISLIFFNASSISTMKERHLAITKEIKELKEGIGENEKKTNEIQIRIGEISTLQNKIQRLKDVDVAADKDRLAIKETVDDTNTLLTTLTDRVLHIEAFVDKHSDIPHEELTVTPEEIAEVRDEIKSLKTELSNYKNLNTEISSLNTEISSLKEEIELMKEVVKYHQNETYHFINELIDKLEEGLTQAKEGKLGNEPYFPKPEKVTDDVEDETNEPKSEKLTDDAEDETNELISDADDEEMNPNEPILGEVTGADETNEPKSETDSKIKQKESEGIEQQEDEAELNETDKEVSISAGDGDEETTD
jgi:chromosome segregation ATPase